MVKKREVSGICWGHAEMASIIKHRVRRGDFMFFIVLIFLRVWKCEIHCILDFLRRCVSRSGATLPETVRPRLGSHKPSVRQGRSVAIFSTLRAPENHLDTVE